MKIFNLSSANPDLPKYLQLAQLVQTAIRNGKLLAGDALPSAMSLANDLHLNRHTVMRSFAELIAQHNNRGKKAEQYCYKHNKV
jgi:GntR family transcriptional regulator/MocR family aminotransferase